MFCIIMVKITKNFAIIWLLLELAQICQFSFADEIYLTQDSLQAVVEAYNQGTQPIFIAFYDEGDLEGSNRAFLVNVQQACLANSELKLQFFIYGSSIPENIRDKYFLHYYTLPKLKFFGPERVETYYGGPSLKAVDAWIKRKFREEI